MPFQSTPPREGRRTVPRQCWLYQQFQSTPPREGRRTVPRQCWLYQQFQSTPPREGRRGMLELHLHVGRVSIHAPARGATPRHLQPAYQEQGFNPRPRAEGDGTCQRHPRCRCHFNPRPRVEGDLLPIDPVARLDSCFNPRPRAGRRVVLAKKVDPVNVSIHAA